MNHDCLVLPILLCSLVGIPTVQAESITILTSKRAADITAGDADDDLNSYFNANGFSSSLFTGTITTAQLQNRILFIAMLPDDDFEASEISAMSSFLSNGGRILFMGDQHRFSKTQNEFVNSALSSLGCSMLLESRQVGRGFHNTLSENITPHPFNANVSVINHATMNVISGVAAGDELFFAGDGKSVWGGVDSVMGGTIILLADTNILSHIEDTEGNDNHTFFSNIAAVDESASSN